MRLLRLLPLLLTLVLLSPSTVSAAHRRSANKAGRQKHKSRKARQHKVNRHR